jgi:hypothetical protein
VPHFRFDEKRRVETVATPTLPKHLAVRMRSMAMLVRCRRVSAIDFMFARIMLMDRLAVMAHSGFLIVRRIVVMGSQILLLSAPLSARSWALPLS